MNLEKTKLMSSEADVQIETKNKVTEEVQEYTYLGHVMKPNNRNNKKDKINMGCLCENAGCFRR